MLEFGVVFFLDWRLIIIKVFFVRFCVFLVKVMSCWIFNVLIKIVFSCFRVFSVYVCFWYLIRFNFEFWIVVCVFCLLFNLIIDDKDNVVFVDFILE